MPTCPDGHESAAADFCDTCGMRIAGAPAASPSASSAATAAGPACPQCGADKSGQFCEACGFNFTMGAPVAQSLVTPPAAAGPPAQPSTAVQQTPAQAPAPMQASTAVQQTPAQAPASVQAPAPVQASPPVQGSTGWQAVVTADRAYFDSVIASGGPDAASIEFPVYCPERRFTLTGKEMRVGRRSTSRGLEPEIDLTGPPTDPGISHLHAVLIAQPDGNWSVLDPGSSNGTQVNTSDIVTGVPFPLHDGDRVCLGAWTVLTIRSP